jgi:hypothetical protein
MRLGKRRLLLFTPFQDCAQSGHEPLYPSIVSMPRKPPRSLGLPPSGNIHGVFDLVDEACVESTASAVVREKDDHMSDLPSECGSESLGRGLHWRLISTSHKPPHLQLSTRADKARTAEIRLCSGSTEGSLLVNADHRTSHHLKEQCSGQRRDKIRISTCHRSGRFGTGRFAARIASLHPFAQTAPLDRAQNLTGEAGSRWSRGIVKTGDSERFPSLRTGNLLGSPRDLWSMHLGASGHPSGVSDRNGIRYELWSASSLE